MSKLLTAIKKHNHANDVPNRWNTCCDSPEEHRLNIELDQVKAERDRAVKERDRLLDIQSAWDRAAENVKKESVDWHWERKKLMSENERLKAALERIKLK